MILISHRGNIDGPNLEKENDPEYILNALTLGFNVEIDVWYRHDRFYLGHDYPKYEINEDFLENDKLWCHAKDINSLFRMLFNKKINCFWHQTDDFTITSKGFIWTYPNKELTSNSICVLPEKNNKTINDLMNCYGVCSDFLLGYKN
jgi:hypothetical protein